MPTGQLIRESDSAVTAQPDCAPQTAHAARAMPSLRFRRLRGLVLVATVVLLIWGSVRLVGSGLTDLEPMPAGGARGAVRPPTGESATSALADAVASRTEGIAGDTAVGVLDLSTGVTATYAPDEALPTASIVKVDILAALLLQRNGDLTHGQEALAKRMIQNSDNSAATALWKAIGGAKGLNAANEQLGLTATVAGTKARWGLSTTTVTDQLRLLSVIFTDDSPLDSESRGFVRTLMRNVADDQQWGVSAADDPGGDPFYVKNGWLPHSGGWIVNSVGKVQHGGHDLLVVGLSDGRPSKTVGIDVLEGITAHGVKAAVGS